MPRNRAAQERLGHRERIDRFMAVSESLFREPVAQRADLSMLGRQFKLIVEGNTIRRIDFGLPPRAEITSLLQTLRKFMIQRGGDEVYLPKVLNSILACVKDADRPRITEIQRAAKAFPDMRYMGFQGWPVDEPAPPIADVIWDRKVAEAYLFGELSHSNGVDFDRIRHLGDLAKHQAATLWVKDALIVVWHTRAAVTDLMDSSKLTDGP